MTSKMKTKVRLVRCPKCRNLLPEPPEVLVYQCGGCGCRLQAKKPKNATVDTRLQRLEEDPWGKQKMEQVSNVQEASNSSNQLMLANSIGKRDRNMIHSLEQHQKEGVEIGREVSSPIPIPLIELYESLIQLYERKNIVELATHKSVLEEITRSIQDESIQITGISGIGGVGKTTLAKEVAATLKHRFAHVVFVTVSQTVDAPKITKEVEIAAKRIMNGEKVLIILDDVWSKLELDKVGIPCGTSHRNCKILLTSRKSSVCLSMNAKSIHVNSLPIKEAWILFKDVVGERVESDPKLKPIAMKVVKGCGGLPLIIQVVGNALKNEENIKEWETALDKVEKHATADIDDEIRLAFAHISLSYEYLKSDEVQSCFLLCSMFPADFNVPLERLAHYGAGLQVFKDLKNLEDARNRVQKAVKILKSSCLLLDGYGETKMHDVVRDVALLIASEDKKKKSLVEAGKYLKEWQPRNVTMETYTGISLMENDIRNLPSGYELKIPLLDIFLAQNNRSLSTISDEFIIALKEARVVDFENNNITSLPKSLKQLTKLRMLNLGGNRYLSEISMLGVLKNLKILILNNTGIKEIPQEIGELVNLRQLDVEYCWRLSYIAPGVLSKLRRLEELYVGRYWVEEGNRKSLAGIGELSNLTILNLYVPHIYLIPEGDYLRRLKRFCIGIGIPHDKEEFRGNKPLYLEMRHLDVSDLMQVKILIEVSDALFLFKIENLNDILPKMGIEVFNNLKRISVSECPNLLCLVNSRGLDQMRTFHPSKSHDGEKNKRFLSEMEHIELWRLNSLSVIWNCPDQDISLKNLVKMKIYECPKLERLFSVTVAQGLVSLQELSIEHCDSLKEVISDRDEETSKGEIDMVLPAINIVFPHLVKICLISIRNLTSFYPGNANIKYPSLVKVEMHSCDKWEKWGCGTHDTPKLQFVNDTKANGFTTDNALVKYRTKTGRSQRNGPWYEEETGRSQRKSPWFEEETGRSQRKRPWYEEETGRSQRKSPWYEEETGRSQRKSPAPRPIELYQRKGIDELPTHTSVLEEIIRSIQDESIQITGIFGTGGVGKTTLAKEVAATLKHQFAHVVFVTVSQTVDSPKITEEVEVAAKRIMKGEKVLIILDDVWRKLELDKVGIPCGTSYRNCKVLLTSRKSSVCVSMNAKRIKVNSLQKREAWILFKDVVGERVESDPKLKPIAMKVVKGCGGLPLIIQVVGNALKNEENIKEWETALDKVEKHATADIDDEIRLAYAHISLSYEYLKSNEVQSCFLLCSMFPADFNVPLERLAHYGAGLQVFKDLKNLEDARNRVQKAVKILKSSCLLLDGYNEFQTKMHDVVRDVVLLIASEDKKKKSLVEAGKYLKEWPPRNETMETYTGISLMENDIHNLPSGYELKIPLLDIFLAQNNRNLSTISDEFIISLKEARVVDFENNNITSLPKSLKQLTKLRMLNLGGNRYLSEISMLGVLKNLKILILNNTGIKEIPQEIGELVNLRQLDVEYCWRLSYIAPGVISKLRRLEELYVGRYWVEEGNRKSLAGIGELSNLTILNLYVPHIYLIPEGDYLRRLKRFCIGIGTHQLNYKKEFRYKKALYLGMLDIKDLMQVKTLIEASDFLFLDSIENLNDIMPKMCFEVFNNLKRIFVYECQNLLCLVNSRGLDQMQTFHPSKFHDGEKTKRFLSEMEHIDLRRLDSLSVIWNCPDQDINLNNLVKMKIFECPKLERLFSVTVAQRLVSLQKLLISDCNSLKEVISDRDEETSKGEIDVSLNNRFLSEKEDIYIYTSKLYSHSVIRNCPDQDISLNNLVTMKIYRCPKLERLFSVTVAQGLVSLQKLKIDNCNSLKEVISDRDEEPSKGEIDTVPPAINIEFPRLVKIHLFSVRNLTSFYPGNANIRYPSLVKVKINSCYQLEKWGCGTHDTPELQFVNHIPVKANGSTIDNALAKYREEWLREKELQDLQLQEEGLKYMLDFENMLESQGEE